MGQVVFSAIESKAFDMKVGRVDLTTLDTAALQEDLIAGAYDVCRVRMPSTSDQAAVQLNALGFPCSFGGSVLRFQIDFRRQPVKPYRYRDIEFELYDGSQYDRFMDLMRRVFDEHPITYYQVPYLHKMITLEQEQEGLINYFEQQYKNKDDHFIWMVKCRGEYAGIISVRYWDDNDKGDAPLAGVIPEYRKKGLFLDIVRFIQNFCVERGVPWGHTGARLHETVSQKFFTREDMRVHDANLIFYATPFLSRSVATPLEAALKNVHAEALPLQVVEQMKMLIDPSFALQQMRTARMRTLPDKGNYLLKVGLPLHNEQEQLAVAKVYNDSEALCFVGYFEYIKQ